MFATRFRLLVCAMLFGLLAMPAAGATYYVRKTGNNSNNGTSPATAFLTISRAITAANAGDIVYIGAGTYSESLTTVRGGTSATAQIQIVGDSSGTATGDKGAIYISASGTSALTVNHPHIRLANVFIQNGVDVITWNSTSGVLDSVSAYNGSDDSLEVASGATVSINGGNYYRSVDHGIAVNANATVTMTGGVLRSSRTTGAGIAILGASASVTLNRVSIYSNAQQGVLHQRGTLTMTNCRVFDNLNGGVRIDGNNTRPGASIVTNTTANIVNCTFDENLSAPAIYWKDATGVVINSIISNHTSGVEVTSSATPTLNNITTFNNNLYFGNSSNTTGIATGANDVFADPGYTARASNNFTTGATSAGTDRGQSASSWTSVDYVSRVRPNNSVYDIGAYEVSGAVGTVPYFRDFETALGTEWSNTARYNPGAPLNSNVKGPHAPSGTNPQQVTLWLSTTAGTDYTLFFDLIGLNTLDGSGEMWGWGPDLFEVLVDNQTQWRESVLTFTFGGGSLPAWQSLLDTPELFTATQTVYRRVEVPFTATNTVTAITFNANCSQGWGDEGFAYDNVRVVTTAAAAPFRANFRDIGRTNGFWQQTYSTGLHTGDLNNDGRPDVFVAGTVPMRIESSSGGGFAPMTMGASSFGLQAALIDVDSNRAPDLMYTTSSGSSENFQLALASGGTTSGYFQGSPAGLGISAPAGSDAIAGGDWNADGVADLAFFGTGGNWLATARPDVPATGSWVVSSFLPAGTVPTFDESMTNISNSSSAGDGSCVASGDINNDGYADFFYVLSTGRLLLSNGTGGWASASSGIAASTSAVSASLADYDNDGDLDVFVAPSDAFSAPQLWKNANNGASFTNVASSSGLTAAVRVTSSTWGDYDNDGDVDLYIMGNTGSLAQLYENSGAPNYTFTVVEEGANTQTVGGDCVFFDYDMDGDLDLAVTNADWNDYYRSRLFENNQNDTANLTVLFKGRGPRGINTLGLGTRVDLRSADGATFLQRRDIGGARGFGQEPLQLHFGGVNPATTYTLRFYYPGSFYDVKVTPSLASTTIAGRTFDRTYLFDEAALFPLVDVIRWREVSAEGQ